MKTKDGFTLRTVGNEYIVLGEGLKQIDFNKLISLNASAAYLWKQVAGKQFDTQILADLLVDKYPISVDQALADAIEIADHWLAAGIIEP